MRYHKLFIWCFFLVTDALAQSEDPVFHLGFEDESGNSQTIESISQAEFEIQNNFGRPERIDGISGKALRLDGWSTFIATEYAWTTIDRELSIEAWFATESFSPSTDRSRQPIPGAALLNQLQENAGFSLGIGAYGRLEFTVWLDDEQYQINTSQRLETYNWQHLVAVVDLNQAEIRIHLNGDLLVSRDIQEHTNIQLASSPLLVARHSQTAEIAGINLTTLNGALDEVRVYDRALSIDEIMNHFEQEHTGNPPDLFINPSERHQGDYLRPQYHLMPNTSWANEGYGLTYYNGTYHYFFQKNPNAPFLHFMHWGHLTSPDLVDWTEEKIVLRPDPGFDDFGVWSGTTIKDDTGVPRIFYTGVDVQRAAMGIADPLDDELIQWAKIPDNPVITERPPAFEDFRDPYVWKDGETYYMIIGSARAGKGALPTYKSTDLINWSVTSTLAAGTDAGPGWQVLGDAILYKMNEDREYMLGVGPLFDGKKAQAIYWIGKWENEQFSPYFEAPKQLEFARDQMLAPAFGYDEEGRIIYIGIVPDTRSEESQIEAGWRQTFTLPRVVRLMEDSTIGTYAHPNLCRYRGQETKVKGRLIEFGSNFNLPEFGGNQIELLFKILAEDSAIFALQVLKSEDGSQYTSMEFDLEENTILADRRFSSSEPADATAKRGDYVFDYKDTIYVHAFIDRSVIEVFVDNTIAYSGRIYPDASSIAVDLIAKERTVTIAEASQWERFGFGTEAASRVCEPTFVPVRLRKPPTIPDPPLGIGHGQSPRIYPNPVNDEIWIEMVEAQSGRYSFIDLSGRIYKSGQTKPTKLQHLDTSFFAEGMYTLLLELPSGDSLNK